jgi:hypothetical protein
VFDRRAPGTRYTIGEEDGDGAGGGARALRIRRHSLDRAGRAVRDPATGQPCFRPAGNPITVYDACIDGGETHGPRRYTLIFGKHHETPGQPRGPQLGSAVLLGAGSEIRRDGQGAILDGQVQLAPLSPAHVTRARFALAVQVQHQGHELTLIAVQLGAGTTPVLQAARAHERRQLDALLAAFGGSAVVAGEVDGGTGDRPGLLTRKRHPGERQRRLVLTDGVGGNNLAPLLGRC